MKPIIIANWKMNPESLKEAKALFGSVCKKTKSNKAEVVFCPPSVYFSIFPARLPAGCKIGAQNCYFEKTGAFTGEVSASQLADVKTQYVIVGHSERRKYFSENDLTINKKIAAVLDNKMTPVLCIGETQEQRDRGSVQDVLNIQLREGLRNIAAARLLKQGLLVAYEPIWAIGTGRPCDIEEGQKMRLLVKKILANLYNQNTANKIGVLYGGSVNAENASGYIKEAGFEGLLVGGASLKSSEFSQIIKNSI
jgi:triosephosphate isomerase (TIM)